MHLLQRNGISWQISSSDPQRTAAANETTLTDSAESTFHAVGDPFDVLGIMVDVGSVSSTPTDPLVYAVGVVRDPVVQYMNKQVQLETRSSYFWGTYSNVHDLVRSAMPMRPYFSIFGKLTNSDVRTFIPFHAAFLEM